MTLMRSRHPWHPAPDGRRSRRGSAAGTGTPGFAPSRERSRQAGMTPGQDSVGEERRVIESSADQPHAERATGRSSALHVTLTPRATVATRPTPNWAQRGPSGAIVQDNCTWAMAPLWTQGKSGRCGAHPGTGVACVRPSAWPGSCQCCRMNGLTRNGVGPTPRASSRLRLSLSWLIFHLMTNVSPLSWLTVRMSPTTL